jgi:hypothetical protein
MLMGPLPLKLPLALLLKLPFILAAADESVCPPGTGPVPSLPEPNPRDGLNLAKEVDIDLPKLLAPDWSELTAAWLKRLVLCAPVTKTSSAMAMTYSMFNSRSKTPTASKPLGLATLVVSMK